MSWTLARTNAADERSLTEWGIKSAVLEADNAGSESLELGITFTDLLASVPFDDDETLLIKRDGDPFFRARNIGDRRGAFGSSEGVTVTLSGPWWHLQNLVYQRISGFMLDPNANPDPADPAGLQIGDFDVIARYTSAIILGEDEDRNRIDTHDQIVAVLEYAIAKGAPIAIGTIDPALAGPRETVRDLSCADIITRLLKFSPGHAIFWDHTGELPAISIRARANRAALALDIADGNLPVVVLNPRRDLKVTGVTVNYLRLHLRSGFQFFTLEKEIFGPDPAGIGAIVLTLGMNGSYVIDGDDDVIGQETAPIGIAASIYNEFSIVPYEGRLVVLDQDLPAWLGRRLNIASGLPAWAAALIPVQSVKLDLFPLTDADGEWFRTELAISPSTQFKPGLRVLGSVSGVVGDPNIPTTPPIPTSFPPRTPPEPPSPPFDDVDPASWASPRNGYALTIHVTTRDDNCGGVGHEACPAPSANTMAYYGPPGDFPVSAVNQGTFAGGQDTSKQRLFGPPSAGGYDFHINEGQDFAGSYSEWTFDFRLLSPLDCVGLKLMGTQSLSLPDGSAGPSTPVEIDLTGSIGSTVVQRAPMPLGAEHFNTGTNSWRKYGSVSYPTLRIYRPAGWV